MIGEAQDAQWVKTIKSQGFDECFDLAVDNSGFIYITGQIEFIARFDDGFQLQSAGIHDIFLAKYDSLGNRIWAKRAGSRYGGEKGHSIAIDAAHNVYLCGEIDDTTYFDTIQVIGRLANNTFIAKYDENGNINWVRHFETDSLNTRGYAIDVDPQGNVYACGATQQKAYYNGVNQLTSRGDYDAFVFKFDTYGNFQWIKQIGGTDSDKAYGIAVSGADVYVTGYFAGTAVFDPLVTLNGSGGTDFFLEKLDTSGAFQWVRKGGGTGFDRGYDITINTNGNIVCAGEFGTQANFGGTILNSAGNQDAFLAAYDPSGNNLWAVRGGGVEDDFGRGVSHDGNGNLYMAGDYASTANFGPNTIVSNGNADVFLVCYDSSGVTNRFLKSFGGPNTDRGRGVGIDSHGNIYFSGEFDHNITFDSFNITGDTLLDIFLVKLSSISCNLYATTSAINSTCYGSCNGIGTASASGNGPFIYQWSTTPQQNNDSAFGLCAGNYSVLISDNSGCQISKNISVSEPPLLQENITIARSLNCFGSCQGEAVAVVTGNGPFAYQWSTTPTQFSDTAFGLCAGNYSILITDAAGCQSTKGFTIAQPDPLLVSNATVNNSTCTGCNNGTIDLIVSGGTQPYFYNWTDGNTAQNRSSLAPGNYFVCISDSNNCSVCDSFVVTEPGAGIGFIDGESAFQVYPNPVGDLLTIQPGNLITDKDYDLEMFSALGQEIMKFEFSGVAIQFNTTGISKGFYFLKLSKKNNGATVIIKPLLVQ